MAAGYINDPALSSATSDIKPNVEFVETYHPLDDHRHITVFALCDINGSAAEPEELWASYNITDVKGNATSQPRRSGAKENRRRKKKQKVVIVDDDDKEESTESESDSVDEQLDNAVEEIFEGGEGDDDDDADEGDANANEGDNEPRRGTRKRKRTNV
jgi:hypothetical protein